MFDSIGALMEEAEDFAQSASPAVLVYGNGGEFPCVVGHLQFHEIYRSCGWSAIREMKVRMLRKDVSASIVFKRGQGVTVKRRTRGDQSEESVDLLVGDDNASDAFTIRLNLERPAV